MNKLVKNTGANILLLLIIFINIIPFVYMFLMSFKSTINAYDLEFSLEDMSLMQYQKVLSLEHFGRYIFNSCFVAIAGVVLTLVVTALAGYAFAKMDFKGNNAIFVSIVMTMVVPSALILVPLFLIVKNLGMLNTYSALILPLPTAFGVFIIRQAILEIPNDLFDAARIDGCGDMKTFIHVILPLIKSSILAVAIFTFVGAWNNYIWPLVACTDPIMKTLPLALGMMKTQYDADVGLTMACAVINFLPPFIFYLFMQRRFKEGMTLTGIKG